MSRALTLEEGQAFLNDVHVFVPYDTGDPLAYDPPSWGGVVQWRNRYILVFPKPNGDVALTDITDGIPAGNQGQVVRVQDYLANVTKRETPNAVIYGFAEGFIEGLKKVAAIVPEIPDYTKLIVGLAVAFFLYSEFRRW